MLATDSFESTAHARWYTETKRYRYNAVLRFIVRGVANTLLAFFIFSNPLLSLFLCFSYAI